MKKINKEKSLRIGLAIISTSLIASMSGCLKPSKKEITETSTIETSIEDKKTSTIETSIEDLKNTNNYKIEKLKKLLLLSEKINKHFKDNNIEGNIKEKNGIKYNDYQADYIDVDVECLDMDEIEEIVSHLDEKTYEQKIEMMTYINSLINSYNLSAIYENLYRLVLTTATNKDYINVEEDEEYINYIKEDKLLLEKNNSIEDIMNKYNINQYYAALLKKIIYNMSNNDSIHKVMKEDNDFGIEDHIIGIEKSLKTFINEYEDINKTLENGFNNADDNRRIDFVLDNGKELTKIVKYIELAEQTNKYLKNNNRQGKLKRINDIEYYDYENIDMNIEAFTLEDLDTIINNFDKYSAKDQQQVMIYLNKSNYYNNLFINYENFYRLILAENTNKEYIPLKDSSSSHLYIEEGKKLLSEDPSDYTKLMDYYEIDEDSAIFLQKLILHMPSMRFMINEINNGKDNNIGIEDYIPKLLKETKNSAEALNIYMWQYDRIMNNKSRYNNKDKKLLRSK